jgi:hypothetical protein
MSVHALPQQYLDKCTDQEREDVESWWQGLSDHTQSDVCVLLDQRQDSIAYVYCQGEEGEPKWLTLPIGPDDLPFDDPQDDIREWQLEYFQHLLAHPELVLAPEVIVRTFHICTDHPAARKVARDGEVSRDFHCPLESETCPIRSLFRHPQTTHCTLLTSDPITRRTVAVCR